MSEQDMLQAIRRMTMATIALAVAVTERRLYLAENDEKRDAGDA